MAEEHLTMTSSSQLADWFDDDNDFDADALERAMVEARQREYAALADLDAA